jgi:hypothetical protein
MKYLKYLKYVLKHKWFVFLECQKRGILWLGIVHDWSKFRPSEFIPYARHFYGDYPEELKNPYLSALLGYGFCKQDIKMKFDKAWLYHIHRNRHHWQHWILLGYEDPKKLIPIPIKYLKEMLADWHGAGKAITGQDNIVEWYEKNKSKILLNKINRKWVEKKICERGYGTCCGDETNFVPAPPEEFN